MRNKSLTKHNANNNNNLPQIKNKNNLRQNNMKNLPQIKTNANDTSTKLKLKLLNNNNLIKTNNKFRITKSNLGADKTDGKYAEWLLKKFEELEKRNKNMNISINKMMSTENKKYDKLLDDHIKLQKKYSKLLDENQQLQQKYDEEISKKNYEIYLLKKELEQYKNKNNNIEISNKTKNNKTEPLKNTNNNKTKLTKINNNKSIYRQTLNKINNKKNISNKIEIDCNPNNQKNNFNKK